jgi:hypothetical protein
MLKKIIFISLAIILLTGMVFGGCSKEEATTAATTTAASTEPIKLGYLTSQSGMFGQTAKYYNDSVDMIVEKYNKAG